MKMKKIVCAMVSAALLVSMAAATAFAVESVPSKTGTDADAGKTEVSASGSVSSEGLQVEVKTTEDSSKEETQLKGEGVEKYLTAEAVDAAAKILGSEKDAVTVSEIKEIKVSGYKTDMDKITVKVPMAALPESGTTVAVIIRVKTPNGKIVNLPLAGVVVEETVVVNGVEELGQRGGFQHQGHAVRADALHVPCAQVSQTMVFHGVGLAVKIVHTAVRAAAVGEQHRHAEAGAAALGEVGATGPDVLVTVQGKAGDHAAALRGDGEGGLFLGVGNDVLLVAGAVLGDVPGGDLIHK